MNKHEKWTGELALIKSIIEKTELTLTQKWDADVYTRNNVNTVSYGGFNDFFAIWFYQGVFLKDPARVLVNAQEGKTKALRQWRFKSKEAIDEALILTYIEEAIQNIDAGLIWKPEKTKELDLPGLLSASLAKDPEFQSAFEKLTFYKQKEYAEYIGEARREATQLTRLEKIKPMVRQGIGLHDRYKGGK